MGDKGETGATGATGATGKSAYELAVENGYEGSLTEWLVSLAGKDGLNGTNGIDGEKGENGKSAFELAVDNGYRGTLQDWLVTLVGSKGDKGDKGDDGVGIEKIEINEDGELVITYTDGVVVNVGTVVGSDGLKGDKGDQGDKGDKGDTGVGIASTTMDANGNIVITYTDGTVAVIEHNWVYSYTLKPATCTETGIDLYSCADCCIVRMVTTEALGHSFGEWEIVKEATVTEEGLKERYCTCGEKETEVIPMVEKPAAEFSYDLNFALNSDKASYTVTGIGSCKDVDIIIPSEYEGLPVTQIGEDAFSNLAQEYSVNSLTIPNSVVKIGSGAFYNCGIAKLKFTNSVKTINSGAFSNSGIVEVDFIGSVTDWCSISFSASDINPMLGVERFCINGELMTSVTIPGTVTAVKSYTFVTAPNLTSVVFEAGVKTINSNAFYNCSAISEITVSKGVTRISSNAFYKCSSLVRINYNGTIEDWNEITKDGNWDNGSGNYVIYCTDGTITKNGIINQYD